MVSGVARAVMPGSVAAALDRPETDRAFCAYLAAEIGFGVGAVVGRRQTPGEATSWP
jgi:hypothetical protein